MGAGATEGLPPSFLADTVAVYLCFLVGWFDFFLFFLLLFLIVKVYSLCSWLSLWEYGALMPWEDGGFMLREDGALMPWLFVFFFPVFLGEC